MSTMSIDWEENETLTVKVSDKTSYVFVMDRENTGKARVKVRRDDMVARKSAWAGAYTTAEDDYATAMLRKAIKQHTGVDYGCEEQGD